MNCERTQGYYENVANAYAPMKGHGGIDMTCGYGSPVGWPLDGVVSNILNDKNKASDGYWAVYTISEYKGQIGELCCGHLSRIDVEVWDKITKGQIVGLEGNKGMVFQNGERITLEMQAQGDKRGSHRHWQWRPLIQRLTFNPKKTYITSYGMGTYKDKDGFFYEVLEPDNGFRGLSPDIGAILNDYSKIEVSTEIKKTWLQILQTYYKILLGIKRK